MSTRRSLAFSFIDRYASLVIAIVSTMIIARLLTPTEIGIFSVTMVLVSLVNTVRDMGAGQYLVQEVELTRDRIRAVWTVQLGLGVALAAAVLGLSLPAAAFYDEPRIKTILQVLAFNYLINPLGSVTHAWLTREMRYDAIAVARFSATLGSAAVSVWLALRGYGAVSLAWGSLAGTVFNAGVSVLFRPRDYPWLPGVREIRRVLSFGSKVAFASIASTIAAGTPEFALGKLQSLTAAGFFSRAQGLVLMFDRLINDAVSPVALSLFSKEIRKGHDASASFVKALSYISALSWTFAAVLACLAHPIVRLLYGDQWDASVDLARILALVMVFAAPVPLCRAALIASGAASKTLHVTWTTIAIALPLTVAGAMTGLLTLGVALAASSVLTLGLWLSTTRSVVAFDWRTLCTAFSKSAGVAMAASVVPACVLAAWGTRPDVLLLPLLVGISGAALGFLVGLRATDHPLMAEVRSLAAAAVRFLAVHPRA